MQFGLGKLTFIIKRVAFDIHSNFKTGLKRRINEINEIIDNGNDK